jgi:Ner family transcriptional regulator
MAQKWDRHSIRAELARRGFTLTGLALDHGLYESACRQALDGRSLAGAQVISQALGVSVQELWPDRYIRRRAHPATPAGSSASPKCSDAADTGVAA